MLLVGSWWVPCAAGWLWGAFVGNCMTHRQRGQWAAEGCLLFGDGTKPQAGILASAFVHLLSSFFTLSKPSKC